MTPRSRKHILFKKFCKDFVNITAIKWIFRIIHRILSPDITVFIALFGRFDHIVILM